MFFNIKNSKAIILSLVLTPFLVSCSSKKMESEYGIVDTQKIVSQSITKAISLSQGWNWETQQKFWYTSQGSRFMPYKWFLYLEQENSTELFRSDRNMNRYNYITQKPTELNPDGLPIGFAKDVNKKKTDAWVGLNCSACHTNQLNYGSTAMVIDGAPSLSNFQTFYDDLQKAMEKTLNDENKFERFAINILGYKYNASDANDLKSRFFEVTKSMVDRNTLNATKHAYGYARVDAFGEIFNMVTSHDLGVPENKAEPNAPVSYPFLWGTSQSDLVQWNGLLSNAGIGPLARNTGEVLGVFGHLKFDTKTLPLGYQSSVQLVNLGKLEGYVTKLFAPQWPLEYFPAINLEKANKGEKLYRENCVSCHSMVKRDDIKRRIFVTMVPLKEIGTDPLMALNATRKGKTGMLEGTKSDILFGDKFGKEAYKAEILGNAVVGTILRHPEQSIKAALTEYIKIKKVKFDPIATPSYKARSLNGIWATAPYLHNGSVPNLWELLKPSDKRVKSFYVGNREFDAKNVGFITSKGKNSSKFDTTLPANSNAGHEYGTTLSESDKWNLVEFMKTL